MSNPLPEPWDYAYEWDGPYGCRKLSVAPWNGRGPDRSVPIFTADQLRAHAAAVTAAKDARIKVLEDALRGLVGAADDDSAERWEAAIDAARKAAP